MKTTTSTKLTKAVTSKLPKEIDKITEMKDDNMSVSVIS